MWQKRVVALFFCYNITIFTKLENMNISECPFIVGKSKKLKIDVTEWISNAISNKEVYEVDRTIAIFKCYERLDTDEEIDNLILGLSAKYKYVKVKHIETECSCNDLSLLTYKITVEE